MVIFDKYPRYFLLIMTTQLIFHSRKEKSMRNITKYLLLCFAILLCGVFVLTASAEVLNNTEPSAESAEDGETILFSYGTTKDQYYVKKKDGKTIHDVFTENTSGNMYITLYSDLTYSEAEYVFETSRKLYLDVNGYTFNISTDSFVSIKTGSQAYIYSSAAGGVIVSEGNTRMMYAGNSNCYITFGCDSYSSPNYDMGKNLTIYTNGYLTSSHGRTYLFGLTVVATGKTAPINRSVSYSYDNKATKATFFLEGCTALETADSAGKQFTVYDECTFVNANTSAKEVALSPNTGSTFTNCSFIGITPTGNEGTFTVTDSKIPTYSSEAATAVAAAEGLTPAKISSLAVYSYKKLNGDTVLFTGNIKLLAADDIVTINWKCSGNDVLEEKWQKGSTPFLDYDKSSTLYFSGRATEATNADATLDAEAFPSIALLGSLSLYSSIDFNLYFKQGDVSNITVDGKEINPTEVVLNKGVAYMLYVYEGMDPKTAASKTFDITYTYTEDGKSYLCAAKASVKSYAEDMLVNPDYERNHGLVAALLGYIKSATEYLGENSDGISGTLESYINAGVEYKDEYTAPETVATPEQNKAVDGATFRLESRPGFAFLLKPDYFGTLTISIGDEDGVVYSCKDGSRDVLAEGGNRWVIFDPEAYKLVTKDGDGYVGSTVTVKEGSQVLFTYSIDTYIAGVLNKEGIPAAKELYNYCRMAYEYFYEKKDLPYATDAIVVNPNGAKGVASFVIDDLNEATAEYIADVLVKNNPDLKVSHGAIANYIATLQTETGEDGLKYFKKDENGNYVYTIKESKYAFWQEQAELGYCDFINHSYSHTYQGADDSGAEGYPVGSIEAEFLAAKQILNDLFGDLSKDVYVIPGVGKTQSQYYQDYLDSLMGLCNEFIAARGTGGGPMDSEAIMNSLDWLNAPMIGHADDTSRWTGWLDQAVAEESLMCYCIHRIYEDASTNSQAIYQTQADAFFAYAQELSDKGDLEIMFYYDALRYFMEKSAVDVIAENYNDERIAVSLFYTDSAFIQDGRMNYPLTVQVEVPANWVTVKYEMNGKVYYANTKVVDGKTVALVNVVPGTTAFVTAEMTTQDGTELESSFAADMGDGVLVDKNYFPGYVRKSVTFTIDDGSVTYDKLFLDILKPAGIKGTFNLITTNGLTADGYRELYDGYELASHNQLHCLTMIEGFEDIPIMDKVYNNLSAINSDPTANVNYIYKSPIEGFYFIDWHLVNPAYTGGTYWHPIATDETYIKYLDITKTNIESIFGEGSIVGYAYPHGSVSATIKQALIDKGYLYARDTGSIKGRTNFNLPEDRFEWTYNADNSCLLDVMKSYDAYADDGKLKFFSFGVHASDYSSSWDMLKEFANTYGNRPDDFWYATNREIFEYEDAVNALEYTNGKLVNDTNIMLYVSVNGQKVIIPANSSYRVADGMIIYD